MGDQSPWRDIRPDGLIRRSPAGNWNTADSRYTATGKSFGRIEIDVWKKLSAVWPIGFDACLRERF